MEIGVNAMGLPSNAARRAAYEFFTQLEEFSARVFRKMGLPALSPWGNQCWDEGKPKGAVLHYTADDTIDKAIRWFMTESFHARASSNVVVSDVKVAWMDMMADGLPLVQALPVTVLQCRRPTQPSWHATWACGETYGIEATNIGELRQMMDGTFNCWYKRDSVSPEWTTLWRGRAPIRVFGKWFCPWVPDQIRVIVTILRHVNALLGTFQRSWIVGHEQVQGNQTRKWESPDAPHYATDKRDPGPHFPLEGIRECVFNGDIEMGNYSWWTQWAQDQAAWANDVRGKWLQTWANGTEDPTQWGMDLGASRSAFDNAMRILPSVIDPFGALGKTALRILGYHTSSLADVELDNSDFQSIWLFQRCNGLAADTKPGPNTRAALLARMIDRGFLPAK